MIQEIPTEFEKMVLLEDLSFNSNQISVIPLVLGNLRRMRNINYDNNPIKSPREDVLAQGSESVILYMQRMYQSALKSGLEMVNANLKHFPVEALTVPKLHSLILDDNVIEVLPAEVKVLSGLTILSLQVQILNSQLGY